MSWLNCLSSLIFFKFETLLYTFILKPNVSVLIKVVWTFLYMIFMRSILRSKINFVFFANVKNNTANA